MSNFRTLVSFLPVYCTARPASTEKTLAELLQCTLGRRSQVDRGDKVQMGNSHWYGWKTATTSLDPHSYAAASKTRVWHTQTKFRKQTSQGLQTHDNIVWSPTGVSLTSLMISSSYPGIMTLGVVMVLHDQRRLHLLKLKNYLSSLSLCQVMPKQAILISSGKLPVSSV